MKYRFRRIMCDLGQIPGCTSTLTSCTETQFLLVNPWMGVYLLIRFFGSGRAPQVNRDARSR